MGKVFQINVYYDRTMDAALITQAGRSIVVFPSDIQAVITGLMQAYADSVDVEKPTKTYKKS